MKTKYGEHSYKSVEMNSNPLELIYIDICDMKLTPSHGWKNYLVTFIDNCNRNDYVYLLNDKDEAIQMSTQCNMYVENWFGKR